MASTLEQTANVESLPCSFKFHNFIAKVSDIIISCQIVKMEDCLYLWIGNSDDPKLEDLSLAIISNFEKHPITTKIMGDVVDTTSINMAKRLSMKLGKPVYVSFNIIADNIILLGIEKKLQEEFKTHADLLSF